MYVAFTAATTAATHSQTAGSGSREVVMTVGEDVHSSVGGCAGGRKGRNGSGGGGGRGARGGGRGGGGDGRRG